MNFESDYRFLSCPLAVKQDIAVISFVWCMCLRVCMCPDLSVPTATFMHGFKNYLTQLLSLRRKSAI